MITWGSKLLFLFGKFLLEFGHARVPTARVSVMLHLPALVITHGQRIIAASAICTDADAESNLISGPCVLVEYCNRGLGTALFSEWEEQRGVRSQWFRACLFCGALLVAVEGHLGGMLVHGEDFLSGG